MISIIYVAKTATRDVAYKRPLPKMTEAVVESQATFVTREMGEEACFLEQ